MKLILASASPRRVDLLRQIGFVPDIIIAADIDESFIKGETISGHAKRLAHEKALKVSKEYPNDAVIAADTIVTISRKVLGKPKDEKEAREYLSKLSGRRHRVHTGICVIWPNGKALKVDTTIVKFKRISKDELDLLIQSREWEGKSGAYMIQGIASAFVEQLRGSVSTVIGLPLYHANNMLRSAGIKPKV